MLVQNMIWRNDMRELELVLINKLDRSSPSFIGMDEVFSNFGFDLLYPPKIVEEEIVETLSMAIASP